VRGKPVSHGTIRIGISGWRYAGWRGVFYPPKLPQRRELEFAAARFPSVEINGTFYSLQRPEFFRAWADATPPGFTFAVKGPRFITHMLKLKNAETALANFWANGLLELGPKLGPVLWQFPPQLRFDATKFAAFFEQLPRTQAAVARLARGHNDKVLGKTTLAAKRGAARLPVRHCVEIRHETFATDAFVELLREHDIGLVVADTVEWPLLLDATSDFVYCRLHGSEQLYTSGYESDHLDLWADRIIAWATGEQPPLGRNARFACRRRAHEAPRDVYVYFDNDAKVRAPFDAMELIAKLKQRLPHALHEVVPGEFA
jgi:uncharacterized protein YecE (DUF72 family)